MPAQDKTPGGRFDPETAKEPPLEARVIAIGTGKVLMNGRALPVALKVGDHVLIGRYAGADVGLDGEEHTILHEDDVLAVIEE